MSNRRHCPFVALILLVSFPFLNAVALFYSDFSFLFLMTMSLTTCPVSVIGHLSTLPLPAHCAIHLPFASHALAHPCFCPLLSTSLLLPSTLLLQASELNFCLSLLLPSILLILIPKTIGNRKKGLCVRLRSGVNPFTATGRIYTSQKLPSRWPRTYIYV